MERSKIIGTDSPAQAGTTLKSRDFISQIVVTIQAYYQFRKVDCRIVMC